MTPTARTKRFFEELGCQVVKVERHIPHTKIKMDTWGADHLVRQGSLGLAIQSTSDRHHATHVKKVLREGKCVNWLKIGVCFYVYSWGDKRGRGKKWADTPRITQIVLNGHDKPRVL